MNAIVQAIRFQRDRTCAYSGVEPLFDTPSKAPRPPSKVVGAQYLGNTLGPFRPRIENQPPSPPRRGRPPPALASQKLSSQRKPMRIVYVCSSARRARCRSTDRPPPPLTADVVGYPSLPPRQSPPAAFRAYLRCPVRSWAGHDAGPMAPREEQRSESTPVSRTTPGRPLPGHPLVSIREPAGKIEISCG